MNLNKKTISIIGGSGFVGSRLAKDFEKKRFKYHIYDINADVKDINSTFLDVEQEDLSNDLDKDTEVIINLAAEHKDDVKPISKYDSVNVKGAVNVCNAARKNNIHKIIFTSSVAVYGFAKPNTDESGAKNYFNDYGRTKLEAESVYIDWLNEDPNNRSLVIIRPTVIFGEKNRGNVFNLLHQIASKKFLMIGNGKNIKSLAYVGNVSAFITYCLSFKSGLHIYNYVDKPDMEVNDLIKVARQSLFNKNNIGIRIPYFLGYFIGMLADFLSTILKYNLPISKIRIKKFSETTQFSSSINNTNFKPPYDVYNALKKTIHYEFIENRDNQD
jgi:nucleoside-diphosphate-sugar epimerase